MKELGDRMKMYEGLETADYFMPLLPVIVRVDGRAFSSFTKKFTRPYDEDLAKLMIKVAKALVQETGAVIGYTQSDEISLIIHSDNVKSSIHFNGRKDKVISSIAATATAVFLYEAIKLWPDYIERLAKSGNLPTFDCRAFNVPNKAEAMNSLLWREMDATKNAITMAASCHYSHRELQGKSGSDKQEMLFQKGVNFNNYPDFFKRGTYVRRRLKIIPINEENVRDYADNQKAIDNMLMMGHIKRHEIVTCRYPIFTKILNKVEVMFDDELPVLAEEEVNNG